LATDLAQSAIQNAWQHLRPASVQGGELVARRPLADKSAAFLCAVNKQGNRHFLVAVREEDEGLKDDASRGLSVGTQHLDVAGEQVRRYVSIQCTDPGASDLFDVIGSELLVAVAKQPATPCAAVSYVLSRWRRFWSELPRSVMTDEKLAGLFGELWFIRVWLSPAIGAETSVGAWRGPFGARHDFEFSAHSVEVKTTTIRSGRKHRVHGIEQLEKPLGGGLLLFSLSVQREVSATNNVPMLVDAIRSELKDCPESESTFDNALARIGYSDAFRDHYGERKFRVVNGYLFEVDGTFPKLTDSELVGGALMPGVSAIEYDIDLDGFRASAIGNSPESCAGRLRLSAK